MREIAGKIPENSRDLVSAVLRTVTGHQTDSIEHINGMGMNNSVSVAGTAHGRFVVRLNARYLVSITEFHSVDQFMKRKKGELKLLSPKP